MLQSFLLQILLLAQHVSGTTMPIIRSSKVLYSGCCLWYFVLWFSSCWSGAELRVMCSVCRMLQQTCWASNKICNKNLCCIHLAFYFHIHLCLTTWYHSLYTVIPLWFVFLVSFYDMIFKKLNSFTKLFYVLNRSLSNSL